ncbi:MAG: tRNA (guanosine(37)-N1)-methyltransferase TrmD [Bdellovibrionota bacterium]
MKFTVLTLYPQMIVQGLESGVVGQALKKNLFELNAINLRDEASGIHKSVDDRPFGGGDGMVMSAEILQKSLQNILPTPKAHVVYMTPQGHRLDEKKVLELSQKDHVVILSGRYSGIDQRVLNLYVDEEISIGDYVLSGGELPALVLIDAVARKIPGVLGHSESSNEDSFARGLLEEPQFTRPSEWQGQSVPEVLTSGNHQKIKEWKRKMSLLVTAQKRPDLLAQVSKEEMNQAKELFKSLSEEEKKVCGLTGDILV